MQDKDTKLSAFNQLFQPILTEIILKKLKRKVDKYVKKLTTAQLFQMIAYAQVEQLLSLSDISNSFNDDNFSQGTGLASFSASQISRRLRDLPPKIIKLLFQKAVKELGIRKFQLKRYPNPLVEAKATCNASSEYFFGKISLTMYSLAKVSAS
jgi:hypothetical protein